MPSTPAVEEGTTGEAPPLRLGLLRGSGTVWALFSSRSVLALGDWSAFVLSATRAPALPPGLSTCVGVLLSTRDDKDEPAISSAVRFGTELPSASPSL